MFCIDLFFIFQYINYLYLLVIIQHFTCLLTMWNFLDHRHQVWQSLWSPTLENLVKFCEKNKRKGQLPPFFTSFLGIFIKRRNYYPSGYIHPVICPVIWHFQRFPQYDSSLVSLSYRPSVRILFDFWVLKTNNKKFV